MNVGRAVSGRERRAVVARAKAARDAAHALLTGEQEALARIGEAAAKLRRCLADGRLDATLIGDLRATSAATACARSRITRPVSTPSVS
ncbi:hypothetical protein ACFQZ4_05970 [Catellatospora coxensis]